MKELVAELICEVLHFFCCCSLNIFVGSICTMFSGVDYIGSAHEHGMLVTRGSVFMDYM